MREDVVGLDVGERYVCAARFHRGWKGTPRLQRAGILEITPGSSDMEISRAIKKLWRKAGFHTYTVATCFRHPSLVVKNCRYPELTASELASAVQAEAEVSLQQPVEAIVYDWWASPQPARRNGQTSRDVVLTAAPRREVERQVHILQNAGLYPVALDAACMALAALYQRGRPSADQQETVCVVQASLHHLELAILYPDQSLVARSLYIRALTEDSGASTMLDAIQEGIRYAVFNLSKPPVDRILFQGFPSSQEGHLQEIEQRTGTQAEAWDPLVDADSPSSLIAQLSKQAEDPGNLLSVALGLAWRKYR